MSDLSRRELLQNVALGALAGIIPAEAAQHVHQMAADEKAAGGGVYQPRALNEHEYQTLQKLAELIVPADEHSPSATAAGAPAFIDLLASQNPTLAAIYTGGIAWLDHYVQTASGANFLSSKPEQQTAILDLISYRKNASPDLGPGIRFFDWVRRMVVDAFYTSPAGVKDLGYLGNTAVATFSVPQAAIDYALKRSPA